MGKGTNVDDQPIFPSAPQPSLYAHTFASSGSQPAPDPIGCDVKLPFKSLFYPLGFPVEIATNCADVLAAANENWQSFQKQFVVPPVQLRIAVSQVRASECPSPPTCRGQRNLVMFVASAHDFAVCDLTPGFASCWLSESTV